MDFVFFDGSKTINDSTPKITIRRGGLIVLNSGAVKMLGESVEFVQLGFDATKRAIAIRPAPEEAMGKYLLRAQNNSTSRLINGKRFLAHHDLHFEKALSFRVDELGGGLIGFTLPDKSEEPPKETSKSGRRKAA